MVENKTGLGMLITAFILIILGSVFVTQLADINYEHRNTYSIVNETISSTSAATAVTMAHDRIAAISSVVNATGEFTLVPATNYSATTGSVYNMYNGKFLLNDADDPWEGDALNVSYTYYPSGTYVRQGTARTLLNLIPLFFVIALLLFVVVPVMKKLEIF